MQTAHAPEISIRICHFIDILGFFGIIDPAMFFFVVRSFVILDPADVYVVRFGRIMDAGMIFSMASIGILDLA